MKKKKKPDFPRMTWKINPKTRIKPEIKQRRRNKDKEREEIKEELNAYTDGKS